MTPSPSSPSSLLKLRLIAVWFALQVLLNIVTAAYLFLYPPDEPLSWFGRVDLVVNTGINAVLAAGIWGAQPWAWSAAVWLIPLYWMLHAWHMVVPAEGLMLSPFLMVDALVLGYMTSLDGRAPFRVPEDRWHPLVLLPAPMFALGLYALLAPFLGMFLAIPAAVGVVLVGWRGRISELTRLR